MGQRHDLSNLDDPTLMARLAQGDMQSLGVLVQRHEKRVRGLAYRYLGRQDQADDLAQEAFLRVLRSASSYEPTAAFATWLYRIVVNLCLDAVRKPRLAALSDDDPARGSVPPPEQAMLDQEKCRAVQRAVQDLPERQRIVVLLHRFEGLTHAEIAQATTWSEAAVESLLVRAYSLLRQRLATWASS